MPLNPQKELIDGYWTALLSRSAFAAAVLPGNRIKTASSGHAERDRVRSAPADTKNFRIFSTGGASERTPVTFCEDADHGVPMRVDLEFRYVAERDTDDAMMPVEAEVEAVIQGALKTFRDAGLRWVGSITHRKTRARRTAPEQGTNQPRTVVTWTVSHQCRPKRSELIA